MTVYTALGFVLLCGLPPVVSSPASPSGPARLATPGPQPVPADTVLTSLWERGRSWTTFLAAAERRRDTWHGNYARARVFDDLATRARALTERWRLLVVAVDACGDSAHTIPYLARFVEAVDGVELRVVEPDEGRPVLDTHPTPDGRGATPTVVLLDDGGDDAGCWVERPAGLQSWWLANPQGLTMREKLARKYAWYDDDAGYHTILEVVESLEAAERGDRICGRPADAGAGFPEAGPGGRR